MAGERKIYCSERAQRGLGEEMRSKDNRIIFVKV